MMTVDIDEQEVKNFKGLLDFLKRLSEDGVTPLIEKQVTMMLDNSLKFFSHLVLEDCFPEFTRLTINKRVLGENKRIKDIKYLKYPPADKIKTYGRCNLPGQSVLYATFVEMTALNELKPHPGDLITKTTWRVKGNQKLMFCPIFRNQPTEKDVLNPRTFEINQQYEKELKKYPDNIRKHIDTLVQFVADAFSKRITSGNHLDYIFSAYFADKIFNQFEDGRIEAIYYPSVQDKLSFENLAIKPDSFDTKYDLIEVHDSVVAVDPRNGSRGYFMEGLSDCKSFDYTTGKILWDNDRVYQSKQKIAELKLRYGVDIE